MQICCSEMTRERDIVRPPAPVQVTPELRPLPCFSWELPPANTLQIKCSEDGVVMTSTPRSASHHRGEVVMRLFSQP